MKNHYVRVQKLSPSVQSLRVRESPCPRMRERTLVVKKLNSNREHIVLLFSRRKLSFLMTNDLNSSCQDSNRENIDIFSTEIEFFDDLNSSGQKLNSNRERYFLDAN